MAALLLLVKFHEILPECILEVAPKYIPPNNPLRPPFSKHPQPHLYITLW